MAKFKTISPKQAEIYKFIFEKEKELICDGAVRTGKTVHMTNAFIMWAMEHFDRQNFGICGKTVRSAERNIINPLMSLVSMNSRYQISYKSTNNLLVMKRGSKENYFYIFGGKDESSYALIQGITLAGVLFDEVALMPESFVQQALARTITIEEAKHWFNCNPGAPNHWFYKGWIINERRKDKKHLHFALEDNPALSAEQIAKTKDNFSGVFYDRYIMGEWVKAEGLVYPRFDKAKHTFKDYSPSGRLFISCDYGTVNPCSMGLWEYNGGAARRLKEYYYNSKEEGSQKTDEEHYAALEELAGDYIIQSVIVDPSAASFIELIRRKGRFNVIPAKNSVIDGIRLTASLLSSGRLLIHEDCKASIEEFGLYSWDEKSGEDKPLKEDDHAMDDIRYFAYTIMRRDMAGDFFVEAVGR